MRRFALSQSVIRCLLWTLLLLFVWGASSLSEYVALQKTKVHEVVTRAQAQRARVSALRERTVEVRELLNRWKGFRERIRASLPSRARASSPDRSEDEELQQILTSLQRELKRMISSFPSEWPVQGQVVSGVGMRVSPLTGKEEFHSGLDIPDPVGTPVHAPGDAIVESAGIRGGKGNTVTLDHGQEIKTLYAHLSEILVNPGERVQKGQPIALVGNSGKSTGPHLHYEVTVKGIAVDPRKNFIGATPEDW
jgi:murein DD-endopeptidase MepM/ murein hydrolase activator NlpD